MEKTGKMLLRSRFEAETDIQMVPHSCDWQRYAEWLEELNINKLNEEQIERNEALYGLLYETIQMLEDKVAKI